VDLEVEKKDVSVCSPQKRVTKKKYKDLNQAVKLFSVNRQGKRTQRGNVEDTLTPKNKNQRKQKGNENTHRMLCL
jgi:hypothetical protein